MLNQLVESKSNARENARRSRFLLAVCSLFAVMLAGGWTYSLFAKHYSMGNGEMEMSNLVAPVAVREDAPPVQSPVKPEKAQKAASDKVVLKELYEDQSRSSIPPKNLIGEKEVIPARQFGLDNIERGKFNKISENVGRTNNGDDPGCGLCEPKSPDKTVNKAKDEDLPEFVKTKPTPEVKSTPKRPISLGVINGKAIYLAKPVYSAAAVSIRAGGTVNVQVLIDEKGDVVSATAVSGHPLLRQSSVNAARQSRFTPTLLSNEPVKVTGVIVYNFNP